MSLSLLGDPYLCQVLFDRLDKHAQACFHQLRPNSISSFETLSAEFVQNYLLLVHEPKKIDHLFKVVGQLHETFGRNVSKFEVILQTIIDLEQPTVDSYQMRPADNTKDP